MWTFIFNNRASGLRHTDEMIVGLGIDWPFIRYSTIELFIVNVNYFRVRHMHVIYYRSFVKLLWNGNGDGWTHYLDDRAIGNNVREVEVARDRKIVPHLTHDSHFHSNTTHSYGMLAHKSTVFNEYTFFVLFCFVFHIKTNGNSYQCSFLQFIRDKFALFHIFSMIVSM